MTSCILEDYVFSGFDPETPLHIYGRHLPHWRQEGALYFITFRLVDSIPRQVAEAWRAERNAWLAVHGITAGLSESQRNARYLAIPEGVRNVFEREEARRFLVELDQCHGQCHLRDPKLAVLVRDSLLFFHRERAWCGDCVIMPNHVYWIVAPMPGHGIEDLLQSIKSFSARQINQRLGRRGPLWQKESFDRIIRDQAQLDRTRSYIEQNPSKAHLKTGEYIYESGGWL